MNRTSFVVSFVLSCLFAAGCVTTSSRWHHATGFDVPCQAGELMDENLLVCVPAGFAAAEVPDVPLTPATVGRPFFTSERQLVVTPTALVSFDPLLGMIDDDVLFGDAFYAGRKAPESEVAKTSPAK